MASADQLLVKLRSRGPGQPWLVHPDLKARLVEDAEAAGTNMNAVAMAILAERFRVRCDPGGQKTSPVAGGNEVNFFFPLRLRSAIARAAETTGGTKADVIRAALCEHYELEMPAKPKRQRGIAA